MSAEVRILVCEGKTALAERAERLVVEAASAAVAARERFSIALAGGATPVPLYERLAAPTVAAAVAWPRALVFWSDERCVPPDDPRSNYGAAKEALLDHVPVAAECVHRMRGEDADHARAASEYERVLRWALGNAGSRPPRLDLVLMGLGPEGHTASLFPGSRAIAEEERLACPVRHAGDPEPHVDRITLTPPAINAAREVLFLVAGKSKAEAVRATLEGPRDPERWPAQTIAPTDGCVTWLLDAAAASELAEPAVRYAKPS